MPYSPKNYNYTIVVHHLVYGNHYPIGYNGTLCEAKRLATALNGRLYNSYTGLQIKIA